MRVRAATRRPLRAHAHMRRRTPSPALSLLPPLKLFPPPPPVPVPLPSPRFSPGGHRSRHPAGISGEVHLGATCRITWLGSRRCLARARLSEQRLRRLFQKTAESLVLRQAHPHLLSFPLRSGRGTAGAGVSVEARGSPLRRPRRRLFGQLRPVFELPGSWRDLRGEACAGREPGRRERFMRWERGRAGRLQRRRAGRPGHHGERGSAGRL